MWVLLINIFSHDFFKKSSRRQWRIFQFLAQQILPYIFLKMLLSHYLRIFLYTLRFSTRISSIMFLIIPPAAYSSIAARIIQRFPSEIRVQFPLGMSPIFFSMIFFNKEIKKKILWFPSRVLAGIPPIILPKTSSGILPRICRKFFQDSFGNSSNSSYKNPSRIPLDS